MTESGELLKLKLKRMSQVEGWCLVRRYIDKQIAVNTTIATTHSDPMKIFKAQGALSALKAILEYAKYE